MKKLLAPVTAIIVILSILLIGCGSGTPEPPVEKLFDLDELITENMTVDQVYALLAPELEQTSLFYQAESIEQTETGKWKITSKEGGFEEDEVGPYQVLYFPPTEKGTEYYFVFFKENAVMAKVWFNAQAVPLIEKTLQGESLIK